MDWPKWAEMGQTHLRFRARFQNLTAPAPLTPPRDSLAIEDGPHYNFLLPQNEQGIANSLLQASATLKPGGAFVNPEALNAPRTIVSQRLSLTMATHQLIAPTLYTRSHERLRNGPNFIDWCPATRRQTSITEGTHLRPQPIANKSHPPPQAYTIASQSGDRAAYSRAGETSSSRLTVSTPGTAAATRRASSTSSIPEHDDIHDKDLSRENRTSPALR